MCEKKKIKYRIYYSSMPLNAKYAKTCELGNISLVYANYAYIDVISLPFWKYEPQCNNK